VGIVAVSYLVASLIASVITNPAHPRTLSPLPFLLAILAGLLGAVTLGPLAQRLRLPRTSRLVVVALLAYLLSVATNEVEALLFIKDSSPLVLISGAVLALGLAVPVTLLWPPADTGTYLDGHRIPQLYHFLGGPSVINEQLLDRIDFFPGGYGAYYGRNLTGAIDVGTRKPDAQGFHGSFSADLLELVGFVEGPVGERTHLVRRCIRRDFLRQAGDRRSPGALATIGSCRRPIRTLPRSASGRDRPTSCASFSI